MKVTLLGVIIWPCCVLVIAVAMNLGMNYFFPRGYAKFTKYKDKWEVAKKNNAPDYLEKFQAILDKCDFDEVESLPYYDLNEKEEDMWIDWLKKYAKEHSDDMGEAYWFNRVYSYKRSNLRIREKLFNLIFSNDSSPERGSSIFFSVLDESKSSVLDEQMIEVVDRELFLSFGYFCKEAGLRDWVNFAERLNREGCTIFGAKENFPTFINPEHGLAYAKVIMREILKKMIQATESKVDANVMITALEVAMSAKSSPDADIFANKDVVIDMVLAYIDDLDSCLKVAKILDTDSDLHHYKKVMLEKTFKFVDSESYEENKAMAKKTYGEEVSDKYFQTAMANADHSSNSRDMGNLYYEFDRKEKVVEQMYEQAKTWTKQQWMDFEKLNLDFFYVDLRDKILRSGEKPQGLMDYEYLRMRSNKHKN